MIIEIEKDFQFEAAHYFEHADANDAFKNIHGHSFKGTVRIEGNPQEEKGWVRDLWKIDAIIKDVIAPLDHVMLNDVYRDWPASRSAAPLAESGPVIKKPLI